MKEKKKPIKFEKASAKINPIIEGIFFMDCLYLEVCPSLNKKEKKEFLKCNKRILKLIEKTGLLKPLKPKGLNTTTTTK